MGRRAGFPAGSGAAKREDALHTLRVERVEGVPALTRWQQALVEKLNRDAGEPASDEALVAILKDVLEPEATAAPGAPSASSSLRVLQSRLFGASAEKAALDASVQWVGVRDFLQEAEVAAGMVQRLLAEDPGLKPAEIGLLLPDEFEYAVAVEDAFRLRWTGVVGVAGRALAARSRARGGISFPVLPAEAGAGDGSRGVPVVAVDAVVAGAGCRARADRDGRGLRARGIRGRGRGCARDARAPAGRGQRARVARCRARAVRVPARWWRGVGRAR